jgi:hypothetical protein
MVPLLLLGAFGKSGSLTLADSSSLPIWLIFERKKKEKRENFLLVEVL